MVSTAVAAPTPVLPVVTSEEQRLALPLGTNYTDRQGRLYMRSEWDASPKPTPTPTPVTVKRAQPVKRVLVTTRQQWEQLPKGTLVIDVNGNIGTR